MDILKPELLWIGNRCYRINPVANDECAPNVKPAATNEYIEDGENQSNRILSTKHQRNISPCQICTEKMRTTMTTRLWKWVQIVSKHLSMLHRKSLHSMQFFTFITNQFFSAFFGIIIGAKAATKRRIEGETRTQIKIPKQGMAGDVEITGASRDDVCSARRRVEMIVLASRAKQSATHFVAVRISSDAIKSNYEKFMVSCGDVTHQIHTHRHLLVDIREE